MIQPVYIEPLPEFDVYESVKYSASNLRNPFEPSTIGQAEKLSGGIFPEKLRFHRERIKEPLEFYPLDSLRMVGTISKKGQIFALLKDTAGMIHRVEIGNYVGQNLGKIKSITETSIEIHEWVPEISGEWEERAAFINRVRS